MDRLTDISEQADVVQRERRPRSVGRSLSGRFASTTCGNAASAFRQSVAKAERIELGDPTGSRDSRAFEPVHRLVAGDTHNGHAIEAAGQQALQLVAA